MIMTIKQLKSYCSILILFTSNREYLNNAATLIAFAHVCLLIGLAGFRW